MWTLKDQIKKDADVFVNLSEFGEEMEVDGLPMKGVWSDVAMLATDFVVDRKMMVDGIDTVERLLFLKPAVGYATPVAAQQMTIDGDRWTVKDSKVEGGLIKLTLFRNEA